MVDFRGVHQHTNGVYTGTTLTFSFEGGINESFTIQGKERAEEVLRQLGDLLMNCVQRRAELVFGTALEVEINRKDADAFR